MSEIDDLSRSYAISEECAQFLQSETITDFLGAIEAKTIDAMVNPDIDDEGRLKGAVAVRVIRDLRKGLAKAANEREFRWEALQKAIEAQDGA